MDVGILKRFVAPIMQRIMLLVGRGIVRIIKTESVLPEIVAELLNGETHEHLHLMQHFGFASLPPAGSDCLAIFPGGDRSQGFIVATEDRRRRPGLEDGETAVYSAEDTQSPEAEIPEGIEPDEEGNLPPLHRIEFKTGRIINLHGARFDLFINGRLLSVRTSEGAIMLNNVLIPPMEEGASRPTLHTIAGDMVEIEADSLRIKLGGKQFDFSSSNMPARIGVDTAGGDVIQEGS